MISPFYYEIPLFIFVFLAFYTLYQLTLACKCIKGGSLSKPYAWFIAATVFFMLWGLDHIYNDLVPLSEDTQQFYHYVISHGLSVISMFCIAIAALKTKNAYVSFVEGSSKPKIPEVKR